MDLRNLAFRIQFEGNESPVIKTDKAVDALKKSVTGAASSLKDMGKSLKDNTDVKPLDTLDKKTKGLKERFKGVAQSISTNMRYAKGEVDKFGESVKNGTDTKPIGKFRSAFIDAGKKITDVTDKATKSLDAVGKKTADVGKKLTKSITAPIAGLVTAGTKMSLDLQKGIKQVSTLADGNILPVGKIEKEVRAISDASGIVQTEVSKAAYSALSAGVDSGKVMEFVRSGIDLTRAGFTDMETAIDATTTVLNAYGDDAFEISKIHDIFVQTQDKGKISVDELGKNIGRVIPTASSLGVNLDQLGASYAILTAKGQNAQLSTTNLNSMLDELGKTGSVVDKVLRKKTGKSFEQLTKDGKSIGDVLGIVDESAKASGLSLKDMFGSGTAGSAAVTLLSEGVDGFNKSLADMDGATGKTAENAKIMEDGWLKIQRATTQVKNALMDAGTTLAPYVEKGAEKVSQLVGKFNSLDDGTKQNIMRFVGLAAAVGPVVWGVSKVIGTVGTVIGVGGKLVGGISTIVGIIGGPLTIAIGLAIAVGVALYKNWDTVKEKTGQAWDFMTAKIEGGVNKIKDYWGGLKTFLKNPIKGTVNIFKKDGASSSVGIDGSHATGLARVPRDGYVAELHRNEEVLTADDPRNQNNPNSIKPSPMSATGGMQVVYNPSINITVGEGTTEKEKNNLKKEMEETSRKMFNEFFAELDMKMA